MSKNDERFLMKVVDLYYKEEMSQEQIAKRLNVSRTTISRGLTKAKNEGYVKIIIDFPTENTMELEKSLEKKYQLKEAVIAASKDHQNSGYLVSRAAGTYLSRVMKNNMSLGITWGCTMKKVIDTFDSEKIGRDLKVKGIQVVPLLGTTMPETADHNNLALSYSNLLSSKLAEMVNGTGYNLPAPMYVKSLEMKRLLMEEPQIKRAMEKARNCQAGVLGIGIMTGDSSIAGLDPENSDLISELADKGGVGEIAGRVYTKEGQALDSGFDQRMVGITLEEMKKIPTRIGVAYGTEKAEAIRAAAEAGFINVLITDSLTAKQLL